MVRLSLTSVFRMQVYDSLKARDCKAGTISSSPTLNVVFLSMEFGVFFKNYIPTKKKKKTNVNTIIKTFHSTPACRLGLTLCSTFVGGNS